LRGLCVETLQVSCAGVAFNLRAPRIYGRFRNRESIALIPVSATATVVVGDLPVEDVDVRRNASVQ
jgi:hypothetical protein